MTSTGLQCSIVDTESLSVAVSLEWFNLYTRNPSVNQGPGTVHAYSYTAVTLVPSFSGSLTHFTQTRDCAPHVSENERTAEIGRAVMPCCRNR
eukprot:1664112-Prymnesium_polylepis.2